MKSAFAGVRWVFLDLGYTLINEDQAVRHRVEQMVEAFAQQGIEKSAQDILDALVQASEEFAPRLVTRALEILTDREEARQLALRKGEYLKSLEEPYPEAIPVLENLKRRYDLAVLANQSPGTEERLRNWGIRRYFSFVVASAEAGVSKPDPAIFRMALENAGCRAPEALYAGDRIDNDIRPAKALGMKTIRVRQGTARTQEPRDESDVADATVDSLTEIVPLLISA